ncbi:olfactory receptor 8K5-like [Erethizon dorsatum]
MDRQNLTVPTDLILSAVSSLPELQLPLSWIFLILYVFTVVGNLGMIILTKLDAHLHTPMYFFIRHLAYMDLGDATVIYPKMLVNFAVGQNSISYHACAIQMALFVVFIVSELFILSAMAYDRYVAICNPLLYNVIMSQTRCHVLVGIPYLYCTFVALLITIKTFISTFCSSQISHFYCDDVSVSLMLCSKGRDIALMINLFSAFNVTSSLLVVLLSYLMILLALCQMRSADGRKKAFSTCASHLTVVVVFFGTLFFMYVQPKSAQSSDIDKLSSVFYTLVIPMLNPLIYSFRNKEVKNAFHRVFGKKLKKSYGDLMDRQNLTVPTDLILSAVSRQPELQLPVSWIFLILYVFTVVGNLGMIILTKLDAHLHTPIYFFIRHLAYMDLGNATAIYPKMLLNFVMGQNTISYHACATQMAFFIMFIISELFILLAMAYDRYVAICNPLLYNIIMSRTRCHVLVGIPYLYNTFQFRVTGVKVWKFFPLLLYYWTPCKWVNECLEISKVSAEVL